MSGDAFYWIGVGVVGAVGAALCVALLFSAYVMFIHGRFEIIFFRKTKRRMSIAAWHNARLMNNPTFKADDFPIADRPFFLSYSVGNRRVFLMLGILDARRDSPISGEHPEYPA